MGKHTCAGGCGETIVHVPEGVEGVGDGIAELNVVVLVCCEVFEYLAHGFLFGGQSGVNIKVRVYKTDKTDKRHKRRHTRRGTRHTTHS